MRLCNTIIGIHGYLGSFKTDTAVLLAYLCSEDGYEVMSNQPLNEPFFPKETTHKLDMDMIRRYAIIGEPLPYEKLFILGDEWQQVMDARRSMDNDELVNTYFIMQTRKRGVIMVYVTSLRGMSDLRLRDNTNLIIKTYKRHRMGGDICYEDMCMRPHYADWYIINVAANRGVHKYWKNPELGFELYDSKYIISPISHLSEKDMQEIVTAIKKGLS